MGGLAPPIHLKTIFLMGGRIKPGHDGMNCLSQLDGSRGFWARFVSGTGISTMGALRV
jgi:hypothetical protein